MNLLFYFLVNNYTKNDYKLSNRISEINYVRLVF